MRLLLPFLLLLTLIGATWTVVQRPEIVRTHPFQGINAPRLLQFEESQVRNLRIERGSEVCIIRHQDGFWQLTSPVRDRIHQALPAVLLQLAQNAQALESFTLEEMRERGQSLEDYGLGKKAVRLRYANAEDKALFHLEVGSLCPLHIQVDAEKPAEPTLYVRLPQSPASERIFLIPSVVRGEMSLAGITQGIEEANLSQLLRRPFEQYRSSQVLPLSALKATQLSWQSSEFSTEAQLQERGWEIISPIATPARNSQIQRLLQNLVSIPAYQLIAQGALPFPEDYTTLTLTAPDLDGQMREFQLDIGISPQNPSSNADATPSPPADSNKSLIFVRPKHRKLLFTFDAAHEPWLRPRLKDLRSAQLLNLDGWAIAEVLLYSEQETENPALILAIDQGQATVSWLPSPLAQYTRTRPADTDNLDELVTLLLTSQVRDFVTDAPADPSKYGLDKPQLVISLSLKKATQQNPEQSPNQQQPASQQTSSPSATSNQSRELKLYLTQAADGKFYAQRSDGISVFEVNPALLSQIPLDVGFWRSKQIFDFSPSQVLQIRRQRQDRESEVLGFNPIFDQHQLEVDGQDLSQLLLKPQARSLQQSLAQLRTSAWISQPTRRQKLALEKPLLSLEIIIGSLDINQNFTQLDQINPASSQIEDSRSELIKITTIPQADPKRPPLWLGQLEGEQSAFVLSPASIDALAAELIPSLNFQPEIAPPPPPAPAPAALPN